MHNIIEKTYNSIDIILKTYWHFFGCVNMLIEKEMVDMASNAINMSFRVDKNLKKASWWII